MKKVRYTSICLSTVFFGLSLSMKAQDNPYKIDNSLYTLFEKATKYRNESLGLRIADTLYTKAIEKNDKKAQCIALTIPVHHYSNSRETEKLEKAVARLQGVSRKNNYLQYYYFGSIQKINNLLNTNNRLRALQEAELTSEQAYTDNYPYGISICMRMIGNIYIARRETRIALEYYQQALEYTQKNLTEQDLAPLYWNISNLQQQLRQHEKAFESAEKGIRCAKTQQNLYTCMLQRCGLLYLFGRTEEFKSYYQECMKMTEKYGQTRTWPLQRLKMYNYMLHQQYDKAHAIADSIDLETDRKEYHVLIYIAEKKYEKAYHTLRERQHLQDSIEHLIQLADLSELNVRIGNEQLKKEAQALQMENMQLRLQTTTFELEQTKSQMKIEKMNSENSDLQLKNRNLELAQFKTETEHKHDLMQARQRETEHQLMISRFALGFFCFFAVALIFYLYTRKKLIMELKEKNEKLAIARNRAEQADKIKTSFIQNMSHEIRTPLNAIVGFSQILSDQNIPLGDKEKQEFSSLVLHNSELLTTLVNDILDLSSLESGKYSMNLVPHPCNEMCRTAISTVIHRKPKDVELCFTSDVPEDFWIVTDEQRMQQVLINLLTNAEKYTEKGKIQLHCSITENPGKITFSVTDTGTGIPVNKMDSIFERFKKLDEFKQGTGLGLNICCIIAERLRGEVKVDKTYTGGARFLFTLPLR